MKRTEVITIRTTKEIKEKVEAIARDKDWSLSKTIEKLVEEKLRAIC